MELSLEAIIGELWQGRRRRQRELEKSRIGLISNRQKNKFARAACRLSHFFAIPAWPWGRISSCDVAWRTYMLQLICYFDNFCFSFVLNSLAYKTILRNNGKITINWNKKLTTASTHDHEYFFYSLKFLSKSLCGHGLTSRSSSVLCVIYRLC